MPDPSPSPRHMALAAEAVTGGPPQERDLVLRVASAIAAAEHRAAAVSAAHHVEAARLLSSPVDGAVWRERVAQAIADAEQRGAARILAEHTAADTAPRV